MPIPYEENDDPYDRWMESTNEGRGFDLMKGGKFIEPQKFAFDVATYLGQTHALYGLLQTSVRMTCPEGMDFHAYLKGKNMERHDLLARP
jgi:hypothetical protein